MSTLETAERDIGAQDRSARTAAEWLWPLLPIGVSVFSLSALFYYHFHHDAVTPASALQVLIAGIYRTFGLAPAVMFFVLVGTWSTIWFVVGRLERPLVRLGRLALMGVMLGVFLNLGDGGVTPALHKGQLGAWLAGTLVSAIGYLPSIVVVWAMTFAALLLATDFFFSDSFERLRPRQAVATETGVESAVTDHLRGLGAMMPSGLPLRREFAVPSPAVEEAPVAGSPAADRDAEVTTGDAAIDRENLDALPPMPSHTDEEWAPKGPDNLEIGDPENAPAAALGGDPGPIGEAIEPAAGELGRGLDAVDRTDGDEPETAPAEPPAASGSFAAPEPIVNIPRPDVPPRARPVPLPEPFGKPVHGDEAPAVRQQGLFDAGVDEGLIAEAIELLTGTRRVSASLLQRRLRIDYDRALELLAQLAARGVIELEADASQGRVRA